MWRSIGTNPPSNQLSPQATKLPSSDAVGSKVSTAGRYGCLRCEAEATAMGERTLSAYAAARINGDMRSATVIATQIASLRTRRDFSVGDTFEIVRNTKR
jgi:hypothetical protein